MTCPICNQKIDPSDHSEKWGPEFAHSRCVIAFTAGSAIQDAKLQDRINRLEAVVNDPEALWTNWLRGDVKLPAGIGDVRQYQERIKRLVEAGDALKAAGYFGGFGDAVNKWIKSKEAKP